MENEYKVILKSEEFKSVPLFGAKPIVEPYTIIVYRGERDSFAIFYEGQQPTRGELNSGGYTSVYTIDAKGRQFTIEKQIDSKDPLEKFKIKIDITVKVGDPRIIVKNGKENGKVVIEEYLFRKLEAISCKSYIDKYEELQKEIDEIVGRQGFNSILEEEGFKIEFLKIRVLLSDENLQKLRSKRQSQEQKVKEKEDELENYKRELDKITMEIEIKKAQLQAAVRIEEERRELERQ